MVKCEWLTFVAHVTESVNVNIIWSFIYNKRSFKSCHFRMFYSKIATKCCHRLFHHSTSDWLSRAFQLCMRKPHPQEKSCTRRHLEEETSGCEMMNLNSSNWNIVILFLKVAGWSQSYGCYMPTSHRNETWLIHFSQSVSYCGYNDCKLHILGQF